MPTLRTPDWVTEMVKSLDGYNRNTFQGGFFVFDGQLNDSSFSISKCLYSAVLLNQVRKKSSVKEEIFVIFALDAKVTPISIEVYILLFFQEVLLTKAPLERRYTECFHIVEVDIICAH